MNGLLHQTKLFLNKNASTILTCVGGAGVVATTVLAVKATPKAVALVQKAEKEKGEKLTALETIRVAGPSYIPTFVVGASTIACIFGANALNKRQQAALTSAYALVSSSYKEYKNKVAELYGETAEEDIRKEIVKNKYVGDDIPVNNEKQLFYDEFSNRYFHSTTEAVLRAEYQLNRDFIMKSYAHLNEFYDLLGLEPIDSGWTLGWAEGVCLENYWQNWIDFAHMKVVLEDGLECTILTIMTEPIPDFEDLC